MATTRLSDRERQLLELARHGLTDQAIATRLAISVPTVATYWARIRLKMGALSRPELVAQYVEGLAAHEMEALRAENDALRSELARKSTDSWVESMADLVLKAPEAVLFVDRTGHILFGNEAASEMFGCDVATFPSLRVGNFIPPQLHETHRQHRDEFFTVGERTTMGDHHGVPARRMDGTEIRIRATISLAETPSGPIAIFFARTVQAFTPESE